MRATAALISTLLPPVLLTIAAPARGAGPEDSRPVAEYARATYGEATVETLADLVAFRTVHKEGTANAEHPPFRAMTRYLREKAAELGLEFADHGAVVVVSLGRSPERLGIVTHGDVQPADPSKWARDPFTLDATSEPGRLLGRGTEDDKGPIATALYAMGAVADRGVPLARRIELIVSYTEESDWEPFQAFLAERPPPDLNVALDSEYPVVVAEKGWGMVRLTLPPVPAAAASASSRPALESFTGGAFISQIPEDAEAVVRRPTPELERLLLAEARKFPRVRFSFTPGEDSLTIRARGLAAHSSKPWEGRNAITHLAALLDFVAWPDSQAARMVRLVNDLIGTGDYAERFGDLAHSHPFMGPLTLSLTTLAPEAGGLVAGINVRRPAGPTNAEIERRIAAAVDEWKQDSGIADVEISTLILAPYSAEDAPQVPVLLDIFRRYTGIRDAAPLSIGGGTHARLVPNGVNFGPAMPGKPYTGHSEHEYIERDQLLLNLEMYTAMLVELAGR